MDDNTLAELFARRVALALENAQLHTAAIEANRAKDEFLATVSHELRTLMTATLGWVRMLTIGSLDEETTLLAVDSIDRSTRAQARLIEDILDVSSIISGKFRLEVGPVDLRAVITNAIETLRPAATAKQIAIDVTLDFTPPLQGDANRLQQVVWNLLSNAIKFVPRGGHIAVQLSRGESAARIVVSDDGPGIDPAFLPHVFERFRQADGGSARAHSGLGLGLAIVRHLAELHGGNATVERPATATAPDSRWSCRLTRRRATRCSRCFRYGRRRRRRGAAQLPSPPPTSNYLPIKDLQAEICARFSRV